MKLTLKRGKSSDKSTIGELFVDGKFECYILEDVVREKPGVPVSEWKIKGKTAIPVGRYDVAITMSPKYGRMMPLLVNVPGYEGIRIHSGNVAEDTEGCLLTGKTKGIDSVGGSRDAFQSLFDKLKNAKGPISIEVKAP